MEGLPFETRGLGRPGRLGRTGRLRHLGCLGRTDAADDDDDNIHVELTMMLMTMLRLMMPLALMKFAWVIKECGGAAPPKGLN